MPGVQNGQTDFAVVVEVGVETDCMIARRLQVDVHRRVRVVRREPYVEFETAVLVWRIRRTRD